MAKRNEHAVFPGIPGLRRVRPLGHGGMGEVWLCRDEALGIDRAVKFLLPERAGDAILRARFAAEARTLAALGDVPGIVRVHSAGENPETGHPFFVMDAHLLSRNQVRAVCTRRLGLSPAAAATIVRSAFADDSARPFTLEDALGNEADGSARQLPERVILSLAREIAAALAALHGHAPPVVHRDLKPANLLFTADGRLLLADFGVAKTLDPAHAGPTLPGVQPGTQRYAAPELLHGTPATPAADWYALGVVLFRALYSSFPEWGEAFPTHSGLRPTSPLWKPLLRDLLAKDPARRLANAAAFSRRLDTIERSLSSPPRRRRGVGVLLGGLGVLGALGILGFLGYLGSLDNSSPASDRAETPALSDSRTSDGQRAREAEAEALQPPEADKSHAEIAEASSETSGARRADPPSAGSREYTRDDIRLTPQSERVAEAVRNDDLHEFEPSMRRRLKELLPVENPLDVVGLPPGYDAARLEQARMYGTEIANTYREILADLYARHLSGDEPGPADLAAASIPFDEWRAWVVRQDAAGKPVQPNRKIPPASPESGTKESLP